MQKTPAEQLREEKSHEQQSINLLETLQKKSLPEYTPKQEYLWLNDKEGKQTNVAESEDKYGIKSVDTAKRSEETSHSLLSFDIKRNERENKTIRNLLEMKTQTDYPKPDDIKTHKYSSENNYVLGTLSSKHEALYKYDAIGEDNAGGPSYGAYQIATRTGTMKKYIDYLQNNTAFEKYADKLNNAGGAAAAEAKTQTFQNTWKSLAKDGEFNKSQKQFIVETHLKPLLEKISDKNIINIEKRHPVIKDVLYSLSVQHSGAKKIIDRATSSIKNKYGNQAPDVDDSILIKEIYEQRSKYVKSLPESEYRGDGKITKNEKDNILKNRYPEELKDALNYLK